MMYCGWFCQEEWGDAGGMGAPLPPLLLLVIPTLLP